MRVLLVTRDLGDNSVGRAYCLWLLAEELGWELRVHGHGGVWAPLATDRFAMACTTEPIDALLDWADVVVAYQAVPETLGRVAAAGRPIVVDVDDPGWEIRFGLGRAQRARVALGRARRGRHPFAPRRVRRLAAGLPVLVGNPSLLELYPGATVVPHVRVPRPVVAMPQGPLTVAFVGTVRPGKGLDLVRDAVAAVGAGLLITADAPLDARPGERWVGTTTVEEGRAIVEQAHAAAVLSEVGSWRDHQLPVKIVDAMLAGRVVVGSRLAPITWALGDSGLVVDRTHAAIVAALESLQDPATRAAIGDAARERSLSMFTPGAVAPVFERVLATAGR